MNCEHLLSSPEKEHQTDLFLKSEPSFLVERGTIIYVVIGSVCFCFVVLCCYKRTGSSSYALYMYCDRNNNNNNRSVEKSKGNVGRTLRL